MAWSSKYDALDEIAQGYCLAPLSLSEAARLTKFSLRAIRDAVACGELPVCRDGRHVRILVTFLRAWVFSQSRTVSVSRPRAKTRKVSTPSDPTQRAVVASAF